MNSFDPVPAAADPTWPRQAIGVFGGASKFTPEQLKAAYAAGWAIADEDFVVVTGATTGVPLAGAMGAKTRGGMVVGVSPGSSPEEHAARYARPTAYHDLIIYTGMGIEGRQPLAVRSVVGGIFIGGEFGTLSEFSIAWTIGGNVLGVLEGVGGVADSLRTLSASVSSTYGSRLIFDTDPVHLARRVCSEARSLAVRTSDADCGVTELRKMLALGES